MFILLLEDVVFLQTGVKWCYFRSVRRCKVVLVLKNSCFVVLMDRLRSLWMQAGKYKSISSLSQPWTSIQSIKYSHTHTHTPTLRCSGTNRKQQDEVKTKRFHAAAKSCSVRVWKLFLIFTITFVFMVLFSYNSFPGRDFRGKPFCCCCGVSEWTQSS